MVYNDLEVIQDEKYPSTVALSLDHEKNQRDITLAKVNFSLVPSRSIRVDNMVLGSSN